MHLLHSLLALAAAASLTSAVPAEPDEPAPQPRIYSPLNVPTKVGLAWPNSNGMPLKSFLFNGKVSWIYTWKSTIGKSDVAPDTLFCSMLWGDAGPGANLDAYIANVVRQPESYANRHKCTMAMNEVNQRGQSDMSPQHACSLIRTHMLPLKRNHGYFLVGPSVTSDPRGLTVWYKEFMSTCPDAFAAFDAISVHWYDVSTAKFKKYLQNWYAVTGKKRECGGMLCVACAVLTLAYTHK